MLDHSQCYVGSTPAVITSMFFSEKASQFRYLLSVETMADEPMEPLLSNQIWDGSVLLSLRRERGYRIKGLGTASIEQGVHTLLRRFISGFTI
jgi:hypothetical protein